MAVNGRPTSTNREDKYILDSNETEDYEQDNKHGESRTFYRSLFAFAVASCLLRFSLPIDKPSFYLTGFRFDLHNAHVVMVMLLLLSAGSVSLAYVALRTVAVRGVMLVGAATGCAVAVGCYFALPAIRYTVTAAYGLAAGPMAVATAFYLTRCAQRPAAAQGACLSLSTSCNAVCANKSHVACESRRQSSTAGNLHARLQRVNAFYHVFLFTAPLLQSLLELSCALLIPSDYLSNRDSDPVHNRTHCGATYLDSGLKSVTNVSLGYSHVRQVSLCSYLLSGFIAFVLLLMVFKPERTLLSLDCEHGPVRLNWKSILDALLLPVFTFVGVQEMFIYGTYFESFVQCYETINLKWRSLILCACTSILTSIVFQLQPHRVRQSVIVSIASASVTSVAVVLIIWRPERFPIASIYLIPLVLGFSDAVWKSQINVLVGRLYKNRLCLAFSVKVLLENLGRLLVYFLFIYHTVFVIIIIFLVLAIFSCVAFLLINYLKSSTTQKAARDQKLFVNGSLENQPCDRTTVL